MEEWVPPRLTAPQASFAREHQATASVPAKAGDGSVYLYHEEPGSSFRWLIAPDGDVLDTQIFTDRP